MLTRSMLATCIVAVIVISGCMAAALTDDYYLVRFNGPIEDEWKQDVQALDAVALDYIPDFCFIVRMSRRAAEKVRALPEVRSVGLYPAESRVSPRLRQASGSLPVTVLLFVGEDPAGVVGHIQQAGGTVHSAKAGREGTQIEATMSAQAATRVAARREVAWVEPRVERKLHNNVSVGLMGISPAWSGSGLFGSGEIVTVCDTGLDTGDTATLSADFAGRLLHAYDLGRKRKWNDADGHGTHVAGSVLGSGALSGSNPIAHIYANSFAGAAPEAQLVFQSVMDNAGHLGGLPADLNDLFQSPYSVDGSRIHTNSWGAAVRGIYNTDAHNVDVFTWNNKDMVVLFSAGNEGVDANSNGIVDQDSIGAPGTAKNCITVGASESYRLSGGLQGTYGGYWPTDYPASPINGDRVSNNSSGAVAFSSRGPTDDGRLKPDVIAPGTNIVSCRSHSPGAGSLWGQYDSNYNYSGGTSMSTPLTAGAAALVRQYYRVQRGHLPSAALVKATLINGATDIYPGQYGTGSVIEIPTSRPNNVEGWGLVNAAYSIAPSAGLSTEFVDNATGLTTGGLSVYNYAVTGGATPVRVTLVWTDYPASTAAPKALVNDLDLVVTLPGGSIRRGNGTTDRTNNVECVDIASPIAGTYAVTVSGYNAPFGPQPYALIVSGPIATSSGTTISALKNSPDGTAAALVGKVVTAGPAELAEVLYVQEPDRTSAIRVNLGSTPTTAAIGSVVTVTGTLQTQNGERVITNPTITVVTP